MFGSRAGELAAGAPLPDPLALHLASRTRRTIEPGERQRAAVLVALAGDPPAAWTTLLVVRARDLAHHPGEIAFPGGRIEAGDGDAIAAALREAEEEVGLARERVRVLGLLDDLVTLSSGAHITPVVGRVDHFRDLRADGRETERLLERPLRRFQEPANVGWDTFELPGETVRVPVYRVPERVWGATARIVHTLLIALAEMPAGR